MPLRRSRSPLRIARRNRTLRVVETLEADPDIAADNVTVTLGSVAEIERIVQDRLAIAFQTQLPDTVVPYFTVVGIVATTFVEFRLTVLGTPTGPFAVVGHSD